MARWGLARWPTLGRAASLALVGLCLAGPAQGFGHIRYAPLPYFQHMRWRAPHIAYAALPADERIAPRDFALDDDEDEAPDAATEAKAEQLAHRALGQNYRPRPAIWRIGDADTTIYLFGTVHVLPPGFAWRSPALDRIVARSKLLLVESVDMGNPSEAAELNAAGTASNAVLPPLMSRVSPDHRATLARFTADLPREAVTLLDTQPTWMAAISVGFVREVRSGAVPGPGADDWIEDRFRATRRPVVVIEDGKQVVAAVGAIPEAEQRRMLDAALDAKPQSLAEQRAPLHAWAKGEADAGTALTVDLKGTSGTSALDGPLLADRNRAWAAALAERLKTPGTILFAAGAGHFVGPNSVLELLRQRGIQVTRVQ